MIGLCVKSLLRWLDDGIQQKELNVILDEQVSRKANRVNPARVSFLG
jgi:hypothetical protein